MIPARTEAAIITTSSRGVGIFPPRNIITATVARPPTRTWPSAPQFQKRIMKAGASARAMLSRTMASRMVNQVRRMVPNAPLNMVTYTLRGLSLVMPKISTPQTIRAQRMPAPRMSQARTAGISSRLTIRTRGSLC